MTVIHVTPGPSFVLASAPDDRPARWCFLERKRLPHTWALVDDPPEAQPSYYEPVPVLRCSGCGGDHTVHPGSYRDGPAIPSEAVWRQLVEGARKTRRSEPYRSTYEAALTAAFAEGA